MITSRLDRYGRTTIPAIVRRALCLAPGDHVAYRLDGDRVVLTKAGPATCDPFAIFGEWSSEADRRAYADL